MFTKSRWFTLNYHNVLQISGFKNKFNGRWYK